MCVRFNTDKSLKHINLNDNSPTRIVVNKSETELRPLLLFTILMPLGVITKVRSVSTTVL